MKKIIFITIVVISCAICIKSFAGDETCMSFSEWKVASIREKPMSVLERLNRGEQFPVGQYLESDFGQLSGLSHIYLKSTVSPSQELLNEARKALNKILRPQYIPSELTSFARATEAGLLLISYRVTNLKTGNIVRVIFLNKDKSCRVYIDSVEAIRSHAELYNVASKYLMLPCFEKAESRVHVNIQEMTAERLQKKAESWWHGKRNISDFEAQKQLREFPETVELFFPSDNISLRGGRILILEDRVSSQVNAIILNMLK